MAGFYFIIITISYTECCRDLIVCDVHVYEISGKCVWLICRILHKMKLPLLIYVVLLDFKVSPRDTENKGTLQNQIHSTMECLPELEARVQNLR